MGQLMDELRAAQAGLDSAAQVDAARRDDINNLLAQQQAAHARAITEVESSRERAARAEAEAEDLRSIIAAMRSDGALAAVEGQRDAALAAAAEATKERDEATSMLESMSRELAAATDRINELSAAYATADETATRRERFKLTAAMEAVQVAEERERNARDRAADALSQAAAAEGQLAAASARIAAYEAGFGLRDAVAEAGKQPP